MGLRQTPHCPDGTLRSEFRWLALRRRAMAKMHFHEALALATIPHGS
jgi:hypothetical protein